MNDRTALTMSLVRSSESSLFPGLFFYIESGAAFQLQRKTKTSFFDDSAEVAQNNLAGKVFKLNCSGSRIDSVPDDPVYCRQDSFKLMYSGNIEVYDRDRCFVCDCLVSELVDALNELAEPDSSWVELNDSFFVSVVDVRALYADKLGNVLLDRCGAVYARHAFYRYNGFFSVHNLFYHKAIAGQRGKRHTMSNITVFE